MRRGVTLVFGSFPGLHDMLSVLKTMTVGVMSSAMVFIKSVF